jgi:hypothetical protein
MKFIWTVTFCWAFISILRTDQVTKLWRNFDTAGLITEIFFYISSDCNFIYEGAKKYFNDNSDTLQLPSLKPPLSYSRIEEPSERMKLINQNIQLLEQAERSLDRAESFLSEGQFTRNEAIKIRINLKEALQSNSKIDQLLSGYSKHNLANHSNHYVSSRIILNHVSQLNDQSLNRWYSVIQQSRKGILARRLHLEDLRTQEQNKNQSSRLSIHDELQLALMKYILAKHASIQPITHNSKS